MNQKLINFPPFYFFVCILFCVLSRWIEPFTVVFPFPFNLIGIVPFVAGFSVLSKASTIFNQKQTTFYLGKPSEFVVEGPFKFSRNPMYLGALILILGLAILMGNFIALLSPLVYLVCTNFLVIPAEEKMMENNFGTSYLEYQKKVRKWL